MPIKESIIAARKNKSNNNTNTTPPSNDNVEDSEKNSPLKRSDNDISTHQPSKENNNVTESPVSQNPRIDMNKDPDVTPLYLYRNKDRIVDSDRTRYSGAARYGYG